MEIFFGKTLTCAIIKHYLVFIFAYKSMERVETYMINKNNQADEKPYVIQKLAQYGKFTTIAG